MRKIKSILLALLNTLLFVSFMFCTIGHSIELPLPHEPPIQVTGVEIVGDHQGIRWNANTESDLAGYLVGFSVNTAGYTYDKDKVIDVGNVITFLFNDPRFNVEWIAGNSVCFAIAAYDYNDNVSAFTKRTDNGEDVCISFFVDSPPGSPTGLDRY